MIRGGIRMEPHSIRMEWGGIRMIRVGISMIGVESVWSRTASVWNAPAVHPAAPAPAPGVVSLWRRTCTGAFLLPPDPHTCRLRMHVRTCTTSELICTKIYGQMRARKPSDAPKQTKKPNNSPGKTATRNAALPADTPPLKPQAAPAQKATRVNNGTVQVPKQQVCDEARRWHIRMPLTLHQSSCNNL